MKLFHKIPLFSKGMFPLDPAVHLLDSDYDDPEPDYVRRPDETVCAIGEHYHYQ